MRPHLLVLGILALGAHAALAATAPWSGDPGVFRALLLCCAAASALPLAASSRIACDRTSLVWLLTISVLIHAVWLPVAPTLSDDVYRYAFEGRLVRAGISPYEAPPADTSLAAFHDGALYARVGHPELSTIYPPLSLLSFAVAGVGGVFGEKLLFALASWTAAACLALWLRRRRHSLAWAALYAWAPLPALEFAGNGHHDALGLALLAAALWLMERRQKLAAAWAWGLAAATKGAALATLPAFWRDWSAGNRVLSLTVALLGLGPVLLLSRGEHAGWLAYGAHWDHNGLAFGLLSLVLRDGIAIRALLGGLLLLGLLGIARWRAPLEERALAASVWALFLSPTFHPWYGGWILLWAVAARSWAGWSLAQLALLSYALPGSLATPGYAAVPVGQRFLFWIAPALVWWWERGLTRSAARKGGTP